MHVTSEAFVLNKTKYLGNASILKVYSQTHGLLTFFYKSTKKSSNSYFHPFSRVEISFTYQENKPLQKMQEINLVDPIYQISIPQQAVLSFVSELIYKSATEQEKNEELYALFSTLFEEVKQNNHIGYLPFYFLLHYSNSIGFLPKLSNSSDLVPSDLKKYFMYDDLYLFHHIIDQPIASFSLLCDKNNKNRLLDAFILFYKEHIFSGKEINSVEVYREVFYE